MTTFSDPKTRGTLFSSTEKTHDGGEWETPADFFKTLDDEFHFSLDACATTENAKCATFYTKEQDGLSQPWRGVVFCNPPYGREIGKWLAKGIDAAAGGATVVFLIHARTDTRWFHRYVYNLADDIRFIKGRLKFEHKDGRKQSAPFPSMVVVYRQGVL